MMLAMVFAAMIQTLGVGRAAGTSAIPGLCSVKSSSGATGRAFQCDLALITTLTGGRAAFQFVKRGDGANGLVTLYGSGAGAGVLVVDHAFISQRRVPAVGHCTTTVVSDRSNISAIRCRAESAGRLIIIDFTAEP